FAVGIGVVERGQEPLFRDDFFVAVAMVREPLGDERLETRPALDGIAREIVQTAGAADHLQLTAIVRNRRHATRTVAPDVLDQSHFCSPPACGSASCARVPRGANGTPAALYFETFSRRPGDESE